MTLSILVYVQLAISISLSVLILVQGRVVGLGSSFQGIYRSKRGLEKIIFRLTIALALLFVLNSLFLLSLSQ